jgi:hypothetical protein
MRAAGRRRQRNGERQQQYTAKQELARHATAS